MTAALQDLLSLVDSASEGSMDLDTAILKHLSFTWRGMNYWSADNKTMWTGPVRFTASVDSALALVERVLPGWIGTLSFGGDGMCRCDLLSPVKEMGTDRDGYEVEIRDEAWGEAKTPALALIAACLRALIAKGSA